MTIAIGIDPGKTGGVAILNGHECWAKCVDTSNPGELTDALTPILDDWSGDDICAGIEKVGAMPKQGVASSFNFGRSAGICEGVVTALAIPWRLVRPQDWQRLALDSRAKPQDRASHKKAILAAARARWPQVDLRRIKDSGAADALWIALWIARTELGRES